MIIKTLLLASLCALALGVPKRHVPDWRVYGGDDAKEGQFPFIISFRTLSGFHFCGGSLIDEQWAITAGHCVDGQAASEAYVYAGITKLDDKNGVRYDIEKLILHEDYDSWEITNDIGLIKLKTKVVETDKIKIIKLNDDVNDPADGNVTLSGWGDIQGGDTPNNLQFLNLKTVPWEECRDKLSNTGLGVNKEQTCTFTKEGQGACYGDSGGPLVKYDGENASLVGLVSWGQPCAVGYPDVYTRVASYIDWINKNKV